MISLAITFWRSACGGVAAGGGATPGDYAPTYHIYGF